MTKGIIVVDMPENCRKCCACASYPVSIFSVRAYWCPITNCAIFKPDTKHDWCPIKPLPEKMDYQSRHGLLQEQIMVGWNMCIDKILEDTENE